MLGIDDSFSHPSAAEIKAAGYDFVCRYLASDSGKRISAAEVADYHAHDVAIVLVFEDYSNQALKGRDQGVADAQEALAQADALGFPADRPIYFAVDFDTTEAQQLALNEYLRGAASVIGAQRVGVYGSYYVVQRCYNAGTANWFWQTLAWSGGQQFEHNHIYQNGQSAFSDAADVDEAKQQDIGQWAIGGNKMNQQQAQDLALFIRLLSFESVDQANSHSADDVQHMLADPAYAGAIAKAVYQGEWQVPAWKAAHYDELLEKFNNLAKASPAPVDPPAPIPAPTTPTEPAPVPSQPQAVRYNWLERLITRLTSIFKSKKG